MFTRNILRPHPVWIGVGNTVSVGVLAISGDFGAALEQLINGYDCSVRGLAFHIAGHELHHHRIVREHYMPLLG